jgi:uncharacterized protein YukE
MTALHRLEALKSEIYSDVGVWGVRALLHRVKRALGVPGPRGSADGIRIHATALRTVASACAEQREVIHSRVTQPLGTAWTGAAARAASTVVTALDGELRRAAEVFDEAAVSLDHFAADIGEAQRTDAAARQDLVCARAELETMLIVGVGGYDAGAMTTAHHRAMAGVSAMLTAARQVRDASRILGRDLAALAGRAHAGRLPDLGITAMARLVLADAAVPSTGPHDANLILGAWALDRANDRLAGLPAGAYRTLLDLLREARSPQERAYLLKALAAGYGIGDIAAFDAAIHPYGADPGWLRHHLTPIDEFAGPDRGHTQRSVDFDSDTWGQGTGPTCVAMSTVLARASVDPLYALRLTTGGHPGDPAADTGDAFTRRLRDEQHRVYDDGRNWLQDLVGADGMTEGQAADVADQEVGTRTGTRYKQVSVHTASDRRDVLRDVESAVDRGLPVTFSVRTGGIGGGRGHEMVIVGHHGDLLEVYNPWGYTVWISGSDFVNNRMDAVGAGVPPAVHAVNVPRQQRP